MVQLESLSSVEAARRAWAQIQPRYPDILVTTNAKVEPAEVSGRTLYRLMVGPYATRDDADKVCNLLKSRGRDCFIVLP
jgi:cell division protein FtsN